MTEPREFKGQPKTLVLTDEGLVIQFGRTSKTIPYSKIAAVQLQKARLLVGGYIQFTIAGGVEKTGFVSPLALALDENTVMFRAGQNAQFEEAKRLIEQRIAHKESSASGLDDLEKLAGLKRKGVITESEFEQKKKQMLGL